MTVPRQSLLLKIYIGEDHYSKGIPVYEEIMWEAKKVNLGGATVIKGSMGLGHIGVLQTKESMRNNDLPVVIEAIDSPEKIHAFIPIAVKLLGNHGIIATSQVTVFHQGKHQHPPAGPYAPEWKIKSFD